MIMEKKDWLLKAEIFASLDDRGLDLISGYSDFVSYNSGDEILAEGSRPGVLYIVVSGSVQVIRVDQYEGVSVIAELVPGDIIGELEFFTGSDFNAAVTAASDSTLLRIPGDGESFRIILDAHPEVAAVILYEFLKVISRRIRNANSMVRENSALIQELKPVSLSP